MMGIEELNFDEKGLIPAVVQDDNTGEVLMVAYMNRESLTKTIETGRAWFYSRERKTLWQKGETSGNFQEVKRIMYDCDQDALLLKVEPKGPACHTGHRSCFFRNLAVKEEQVGNMRFRTEANSTGTICQDNHIKILEELVNIIDSRFREMPEGSYVAKLYKEGRERILKKIGEEASEVIIASMSGSKSDTIYETADLIFHLLIALRYDGISLKEIAEELERRRK